MATNTNPFYTYSATAGSSKTLQKPQDGGDNNQWGNYINTDLDEIVSAVNALSDKIADANEKTLVDFTATGSAVNHVGITNAAAGNGPTISTAGTDSNVDLNVTPKGTGDSVFSNKIKVDDIQEKTTDHGVEIEGVLVKDSIVQTDDIQEKTSAHGVEIDGVLVKDGDVGVATISSKAGTSVGVTLGGDDGDDFNVDSGKLIVEGDTGNVGVGATPTSRLHVNGTQSNNLVKIQANSNAVNDLIGISFQGTGSYPEKARIVAKTLNTGNNNGELSFFTGGHPSTTDVTEALKIDNSGNVSVSTGNLDIAGTVNSGTIGSSVVFPTGSVLRIHSTSSTTVLNNFSSGSYVDGITITISNPVSSSSKFLIQNTAGGLVNNVSYIGIRAVRVLDSTTSVIASHWSFHSRNEAWNGCLMFPISVQDAPATTSAVTYKIQVFATSNTGQAYWNYNGPGSAEHKTFLNVIEYQG